MNRTNGDPETYEPAYEIFKKDSAGNPIWIETVVGLDQARKRVAALSVQSSGDYLAFNPATNTFVNVHADAKSA